LKKSRHTRKVGWIQSHSGIGPFAAVGTDLGVPLEERIADGPCERWGQDGETVPPRRRLVSFCYFYFFIIIFPNISFSFFPLLKINKM
jgi:hypothetical protein